MSLGHELDEPVVLYGFNLLQWSKADTEVPIPSPLLIQDNLNVYEDLVSFHIQFYTNPKIVFGKIITKSFAVICKHRCLYISHGYGSLHSSVTSQPKTIGHFTAYPKQIHSLLFTCRCVLPPGF